MGPLNAKHERLGAHCVRIVRNRRLPAEDSSHKTLGTFRAGDHHSASQVLQAPGSYVAGERTRMDPRCAGPFRNHDGRRYYFDKWSREHATHEGHDEEE